MPNADLGRWHQTEDGQYRQYTFPCSNTIRFCKSTIAPYKISMQHAWSLERRFIQILLPQDGKMLDRSRTSLNRLSGLKRAARSRSRLRIGVSNYVRAQVPACSHTCKCAGGLQAGHWEAENRTEISESPPGRDYNRILSILPHRFIKSNME